MQSHRLLRDEVEARERSWKSQRDKWMAENARLREEIEFQKKIWSVNLSKPREDDTARTHDSFRMQELELENSQLKKDLSSLRKSVVESDSTTASKTFIEQFEALQAELERRREECIQLHAVLADHTRRMKATPGSSYGPKVDSVNENGKPILDLEAQKYINRQLKTELQAKEHQWESQKVEWMEEIKQLREEIQLQKNILTNLSKLPQTQTKVNAQENEMLRLTFENWELQGKYEKAAEDCEKANRQIEVLKNRLRKTLLPVTADMKKGVFPTPTYSSPNEDTLMTGVICKQEPKFEDMSEFCMEDKKNIKLNEDILMSEVICKKEPDFDMSEFCEEDNNVIMRNLITATTHSSSTKRTALMPQTVCKKKRDIEGMFEFQKEDIKAITHNLITELKPGVAGTLLPGLPAYILFMCIRHVDYINDDDKMRVFFSSVLNAIKQVVHSSDDFDCAVLWLSNSLRLLHNMGQYSGEKSFQQKNNPRQNDQCLRNFNLSEYRALLCEVSFWIYNNIIDQLKEHVQPIVVPALLEHKAIAELDSRPNKETANTSKDASLDLLVEHLEIVHRTLRYHGVDPEIVVQIYKQLFYFVSASALNDFLLRDESCQWKEGIQMRFNLSRLKQWAEFRQLVPAVDSLAPLFQAAQLLHTRKNDEDVDYICKMCNELTSEQIIKILNMYKPWNEFEATVPVSFIMRVCEKLKERGEKNDVLLMDVDNSFPVSFPFKPSNIRLEDIGNPEVLNLPMLRKV